jgi:membrane protein DedA with SNARE-associated domain
MVLLVALAAATLISEDLASISAGLLVRDGVLGFLPAATACVAGVFIGDLGLWALGRLAGSLFGRWPVTSRFIDRLPIEDARRWLDDHAGVTLLASRFMPGSRLPVFVCAGVVGMPLRRFATWACVGVLLWTPPLVWFAATTGGVVLSPMADSGAARWLTRFAFVAAVFSV